MCAFLSSSYFNSHPHEEDDGTTINRPVVSSYFNSHPHEEDDRPTMISCSCPTNFNSHPHEEDDTYTPPVAGSTDISTHILTKRMTMVMFQLDVLYEYFNSHPHEEDDNKNKNNNKVKGYFNSHPHEEDDSFKHLWVVWVTISTHILTKRMTIFAWYVCYCICISTHILTKRMTK